MWWQICCNNDEIAGESASNDDDCGSESAVGYDGGDNVDGNVDCIDVGASNDDDCGSVSAGFNEDHGEDIFN